MILKTLEVELERVAVSRRGDDVVVVACSGGVDSMVLAHAATTLLGARRVVVGHVDHAVRPESADDAARVRGFAETLGARAEVTRLPDGPDGEARLREARYEALEAQRVRVGGRWLLVAHNREDQAETILLRLIRTTDPSCFLGMPRRRGRILRPLLDVSRNEIQRYARRHRLTPIEDPSNLEARFMRNRVRRELLPLLESRYRPGFARRLVEASLDARRAAGAAASVSSPEDPRPAAPLDPPSASISPWRVRFARIPWPGVSISPDPAVAVFDAAFLETPAVRCYRPGDRIRPYGMLGARKVADVLREGGIPANNRRFMPVVVDAQDDVVWVPGFVRSRTAPVSDSTKSAWVLTVERDALPGADVREKVQSSSQEASDREGLSPNDPGSKGRKR